MVNLYIFSYLNHFVHVGKPKEKKPAKAPVGKKKPEKGKKGKAKGKKKEEPVPEPETAVEAAESPVKEKTPEPVKEKTPKTQTPVSERVCGLKFSLI